MMEFLSRTTESIDWVYRHAILYFILVAYASTEVLPITRQKQKTGRHYSSFSDHRKSAAQYVQVEESCCDSISKLPVLKKRAVEIWLLDLSQKWLKDIEGSIPKTMNFSYFEIYYLSSFHNGVIYYDHLHERSIVKIHFAEKV